MAFPIDFLSPEGKYIIGDIVICPEVAEEEARIAKSSTFKRLVELLIHGILHINGYKDKTNRQWIAMKKKQEQIYNEISKAGLLN